MYARFKSNIEAADLPEMGSLYSKNGGDIYLGYVTYALSKYVWVKPLNNKKAKTVLNGFIEIANESKHKSDKSWVDQKWLVDNRSLMYLTYNEGKSVVLEKFIRTLTGKIYKKITVNDSKTYLGHLNLVDEYNNTHNCSIG